MNNDKFIEDKDIIFAEPEWPYVKIKWLWEDENYDGLPLEGMIEFNGKRYYASWVDCQEESIYEFNNLEPTIIKHSVYTVYKLTDARQEYQEYWHELFKYMVYDDSGMPRDPNEDMFKFFYGRLRKDYERLDFVSGRDGKVVGWFMD